MPMDLATYAKLDRQRSNDGEYIRFERTGETRYLRFLYESGGDRMGEDIIFYRKYWDPETRKYVVGTDKGQLMATLKAIEYDPDGSNPRIVKWERSAYFCKTVLLPAWRNYPRIIDGVWKITATSPRTIDASYSIFPVIDADTIKYPIIEEAIVRVNKDTDSSSHEKEETQSSAPSAEPAPARPTTKKKYWE